VLTQNRINHYIGVKFDVPRLQAYPFSVLAPQHKSWISALSIVQVMYDAFKTCSDEFRVEMCDIVPVIGDFKIVHIATGTDTVVEAKKGHCHSEVEPYCLKSNKESSSTNYCLSHFSAVSGTTKNRKA